MNFVFLISFRLLKHFDVKWVVSLNKPSAHREVCQLILELKLHFAYAKTALKEYLNTSEVKCFGTSEKGICLGMVSFQIIPSRINLMAP